MKLKLIIAVLFITSCFLSCNKKDEPEPAQELILKPEDKEEIIQISTDYGDMFLWLYKATPKHRENFLKLTKEGFYNNTTFHRIISGFMAQGGDPNSKDADPNNDGSGGPGYTVEAEIKNELKHERGALAAARLGNASNPQKASSGSQFYLCHSTSGTTGLNGEYTVYGMVMSGLNVIDSIVKQPKNSKDRPLKDIKMQVKVIEKTVADLEKDFNYVPKY